MAVVFSPIGFDDDTGFPPRGEPLGVETFVAELAIEALVQTVLPRLPRGVENRLNAFVRKPLFDGVADEFRTVVGPQIARSAVRRNDSSECRDDVLRAKTARNIDGKSLSRELVKAG